MSTHRLARAPRSFAPFAFLPVLAALWVGVGACRSRPASGGGPAGGPPGSAAAGAPGSAGTAGAAPGFASGASLSRFCPQDLSGVWVNASDTAYAYRLRDHGDQVDGVFFRRSADGGVVPPQPTEEPMTLELHRTPSALAGAMRSYDRTDKGARCPVEFGLSVTSCKPGSLQVVSEIAAPVQDDCKRRREADGGETPPDLAEFIWERPDAGS